MTKIKQNLQRITLSFTRAFVAGIGLTQVSDFHGTRGWDGVLSAAALAGFAAALRTLEAMLTTGDATGPDPEV